MRVIMEKIQRYNEGVLFSAGVEFPKSRGVQSKLLFWPFGGLHPGVSMIVFRPTCGRLVGGPARPVVLTN